MKALSNNHKKAGTITIRLVCTRCGATYGSGGSGGIGGGGVGPTITPTTRPGSMYDGDEGGNETLPPVVDEEVPDETILPEADRQRAGVASTGHNAIHTIQTKAAALQVKQAERQQSDR